MLQSQPIPVSEALAATLSARDLTDPSQGAHAAQQVLAAAVQALSRAWGGQVITHRAGPVVSLADHFERLHAASPPATVEAAGGVPAGHVLRTRTAVLVPPLLERLAVAAPSEALLVCPGVVHRREGAESRAGQEADLWRIRRGSPLGLRDLAQLISLAMRAVAPGLTLSAVPEASPWTVEGRRLDVRVRGEWCPVGRCGLALPALLAEAGLPEDASGLVLSLDLDRLVMLAKGMDDVALLRAADPRVAAQMLDLEPYLPEPADAAAAPRRRPPGAAARSRGPGRECGSLDEVRWSIDEVDRRIVRLLSERRAYALQAARFKRSPEEVRVPAREEQVVAQVRALAREAGIEADLVEGLYRHLIDEFVRLERDEHRARAAPAPAAGEPSQP